jgi:S1-C subfamily serine protease
VVRGFLGVSISGLSGSWAERLGYQGASRAVIGYTVDDSPAAAAGLERGDVIETIDGDPVRDRQQVHNAIGFRRPGDTIRVGVWRDGQRLELTATLVEQQDR